MELANPYPKCNRPHSQHCHKQSAAVSQTRLLLAKAHDRFKAAPIGMTPTEVSRKGPAKMSYSIGQSRRHLFSTGIQGVTVHASRPSDWWVQINFRPITLRPSP